MTRMSRRRSRRSNQPAALDRRSLLRGALGLTAALPLLSLRAHAEAPRLLQKPIHSARAPLPVIGMGTWITFNVGQDQRLRDARTEVLAELFRGGGQVVDSSPMY